eukprot:1933067-Prymnesium_polylepis.1
MEHGCMVDVEDKVHRMLHAGVASRSPITPVCPIGPGLRTTSASPFPEVCRARATDSARAKTTRVRWCATFGPYCAGAKLPGFLRFAAQKPHCARAHAARLREAISKTSFETPGASRMRISCAFISSCRAS